MTEQTSNRKAFKTVFLMIIAMMLSKSLGLLRSVFMAKLYGDSAENAAFEVASRIPSSLFEIILGAAILGAFIPIYNSFEKDGKEQKEFSDVFLTAILLITSIISFFGVIFAKQIILLVTSDLANVDMAADFLRILFPMTMFIGATYTLVGILQSKDEFLFPALVSAIWNAGIVLYFLLLNKTFGIYGLCVTYTLSWIIQCATLIIPLKKKKYKFSFKFDFKNKGLREALRRALPIMAGSWFTPVSVLVGNGFASGNEYSSRAISAIGYSNLLFVTVTGILTYGICNYIFPKLSALSFEGNDKEFNNTVRNGISTTLFIIIPAVVVCFLLREEIVTVIFKRGQFGDEITALTTKFFTFFIPAMLFFSLIEVFNRVFYAKKKVVVPMIATLGGIASNVICNVLFINVLHLSAEYIALANAIAQAVMFAILLIFFVKHFKNVLNIKFALNIVKMIASAAITMTAVLILQKFININIIIYCFAVFAVSCAIYLSINFILGTTEIKTFISMRKKGQ